MCSLLGDCAPISATCGDMIEYRFVSSSAVGEWEPGGVHTGLGAEK